MTAETVGEISLILSYYRGPRMLRAQLDAVAEYPDGYTVIVVDDGSPEPAEDVISNADRVALYRIDKDIPWNRGGARNLGAQVAITRWIVQLDLDHVLPPAAASVLLKVCVDPRAWYRFPRWRIGQADETRRKDTIPDFLEIGPVKPHIDSYLCTRALYWKAGGYNEDFSGCLGGGSPFLAELAKAGPLKLLPEPVHLCVYTRHAIQDASVSTLDRSTDEYARRRRALERAGRIRGHDPVRFEWRRVL
jgi:glycosyltransferase involved in cell wall biosynthesis